MKKLIDYFKCWNEWRKGNLNGTLHHILVLIGLVDSPTFDFLVATNVDEIEWQAAYSKVINEALEVTKRQ